MRFGMYLLIALAACGDNQDATCELPEPVWPTEGRFVDTAELRAQLPTDCVEGGLRNLPGRWFVRAPDESFTFDYPLYAGTCSTGIRRTMELEDHDSADDGSTHHVWSDGTMIIHRTEQLFIGADGELFLSYYDVRALCMTPAGTLGGIQHSGYIFDADELISTSTLVGSRFGRRDAEPAKGLALLGELGKLPDGSPIIALNLIVDGSHAYVVGWSGFHIINIEDPKQPVLVGHHVGSFNDIRVVHADGKTVAFLAPAGGERTEIIDVTDPTAPMLVNIIDEFSHSLQVQTRSGTTELYLASYEDAVPLYDITNPLLPIRKGAARLFTEGAGAHDLTVDGSVLYVNNTVAGLTVVDIAPGLNQPTRLGERRTSYSHASWIGHAGGRKLLLHGDEGMTGTDEGGAFMRILDGEPSSPTFLSELSRYQSRPEVGIHNIEMHDDYAYIAYYQDGVRVVDLIDPTKPKEVAHFNTWDSATAPGSAFEGALGVRKVGDLLYVADNLRGLIILQQKP